MAKWAIEIDRLSDGGFSPKWYNEAYPRYGNTNQAGDMKAISPFNKGYIEPSYAVVEYPGVSAISSSTLINDLAIAGGITGVNAIAGGYGNLYEVGSTISLAHTISGYSGPRYIDSVIEYRDNIYYSWDTNLTANGAFVGKYNGSTWNDTWWPTTLSATALQHRGSSAGDKRPMAVGADTLYIANGTYVASYDETTGTAQDKALDLPSNTNITDLHWFSDRLYISTTNLLYVWDGTTDSWETAITIPGSAGGAITKNGSFYQFYQNDLAEVILSVLDGSRFINLAFSKQFIGNAPSHFQICEYGDYILWVLGQTSDDVFAYGPLSDTPTLFHFTDTGSTSESAQGGLHKFNLSGKDIVFGNDTKLYYLDTASNGSSSITATYTTNSYWKSQLFDITQDRHNGGQINAIRFNFESLASGAVLNWSLVNNQGKTIYSDTISYAKATATNPLHTLTTAFYPLNGKVTENFRVELDYSVGSSTAPVRIMNIKVYGEG